MEIRRYKLDEISIIKRGCSPRPITRYETKHKTKMNWAKISDIKNNLVLRTENYLNINEKEWKKLMICNKNDILITCCASPGIIFKNMIDNCGYHDGFLKIELNNEYILDDFFVLKMINEKEKLINKGNGSIFINLNKNILKNHTISIPNIINQQQIINIIEPFEKIKNNYINIKNNLIDMISYIYLKYSKNSNNKTLLTNYIEFKNVNYKNQLYYVDTSNISNFNFINFEKISNRKSRANLTVKNKSIIFAKLIGDIKVFPIYDKYFSENFVYSTGFYNIEIKNNLDCYIVGFLLSNEFKELKNNYSSGSVMKSLTNKSFENFYINEPNNIVEFNQKIPLIYFNKIEMLIIHLNKIISNLINLFIK